jgi:hypothetical protein
MTEGFAAEPGLDRGTGSEGVQRYRKRPVVIEARQWTGENFRAMASWLNAAGAYEDCSVSMGAGGLVIHTLEGDMYASPGDWIICGVKGEFYPCKPDIFAETYEPALDRVDGSVAVAGEDLRAVLHGGSFGTGVMPAVGRLAATLAGTLPLVPCTCPDACEREH